MKLTNEKAKELKQDFPIFKVKMRGKPLIYLDNAATSQKPSVMINAITKYYAEQNANIHRGVYPLSEEATKNYENAHDQVVSLISAKQQEIVFTRNTTESINVLAHNLPLMVENNKKELVLTEMEHHSNLVPWQQAAKRNSFTLKFIKMNPDFTLDMDDAEKKITDKTAIVSVTHVSNALGTINDAKKIVAMAKKHKAFSIIDAAQSVPHRAVDVKSIDCDFLAFSAHKMLGPTGIGALYGKKNLLEQLQPLHFGGDMIRKVTYQDAEWNDLPMKFEAGTQHIAGAIGFNAAIEYLNKIGIENIQKWEEELTSHALDQLKTIPDIKIFNPGKKKTSGIISFSLNNIHAHDVASLLSDDGICIRGGHHCAMPLMQKLGISGTSRMSFYLYNSMEDIDKTIDSLKKTRRVFHG